MFFKKSKLFFFALIILISCKKSEPPTDISTTLQAHLWYPYQTEIIAVDTITIQKYNPYPFLVSTKTTIVNLDTIIISDNCLLNSTFKFTADSGVNITNPCNSIQPSNKASWSLFQDDSIQFVSINNPLEQTCLSQHFPFLFPFVNFPPGTTYSFYQNQGKITVINNSQFMLFTQNDSGKMYSGSYMIDTAQKFKVVEYTTYRSKN